MKIIKIALLAAATVSLFGCTEKKGIGEVTQNEWMQNVCWTAAVKQEYTRVTLYKRSDASPVEFIQKTTEDKPIIEKCGLRLFNQAQAVAMTCKSGGPGCRIDINDAADTQVWLEKAAKEINEQIKSKVAADNRSEYTTMPVKQFTVGRP